MCFNRITTYSLAESETNEAVENKTAFANYTATYLEPDRPWSPPTYHLSFESGIPVLKISPGGGYISSNSSGYYMVGKRDDADELLNEACESMEKCKQRYSTVMQENIKSSLSALLRLMNYAYIEHQSTANVPWDQLVHMMNSFSYVEISPYPNNIELLQSAQIRLYIAIKDALGAFDHTYNVPDETEIETALLKMQRYLSSLAAMKNERKYSLIPAQSYIESLFRDIYEVDFVLGSVLENPLTLPKYAALLKGYFISKFSPVSWIAANERAQAMGFFYPDATQLVTMNNHFHILPRTANENCNWLEVQEINEKLVTVTLQYSGTFISFNDAVLMVKRNGSFFMLDENDNVVPLEFPFSSSGYFCSKATDYEVQCENPFETLRYIFDPQKNEIVGYADVLISPLKKINGILGMTVNDSAVLPLALPDGTNGANEAEFFNNYLLTEDASCRFTPQDFTEFQSTSNGQSLCKEAFDTILSGSLQNYAWKYDALLNACRQRTTTKQETCKYTDVLVHSLRSKNVPAQRDPDCLHCGVNEPVVTDLNRVNLILLVSRSVDTLPLNPKAILLEIAQKTIQTLNDQGISDVYVTLVTYGGPQHFYIPAKNTIKNSVSSSKIDDIESTILKLEFNGPSYDSSSTLEAMRYAAETFDDTYKGIINSVVIVAPESLNRNIGGVVPAYLVRKFNDELVNLFLVSSMNNEECAAAYVTAPSQASGGCYTASDLTQLEEAIQNGVQGKINRSVTCTCRDVSELVGQIESQCHFV